jgi:hypothetical protein
MDDDILPIISPLNLIISTQKCWKCRKSQKVIALAVWLQGEVGETESEKRQGVPSIVCDIVQMPQHLHTLVQSIHPPYRKHQSKTAGQTYFANFCECGANFGDHFLFMEPGGAFFPMDDETASQMVIRTLAFEAPVQIVGNICYGAEDIIFENAQRV